MKLRSFMGDELNVLPGSVKIPIGEVMKKYRERYDALKKRAKFHHQVYTVSPGARQMCHVKVPSETVDGMYYDVIIQFDPGKSSTDWMDCDIKVFSNCPSFVYGYAYVFAHWRPEGRPANQRDQMMVDTMKGRVPKDSMFIDGLSQKIGPQPTHDKPVIRNPLGLPMFDKSICFAVWWTMDNMTLPEFMHVHNNVMIKQVAASVMDYTRLMNERTRLANRQKEKKARDHKTTAKVIRVTEKEIADRGAGVRAPLHAMKPRTISSTAAKTKPTGKPQGLKSTRIKSKS